MLTSHRGHTAGQHGRTLVLVAGTRAAPPGTPGSLGCAPWDKGGGGTVLQKTGGIQAVHHRTDVPGAGVERRGMWCPQITGPVHPSTLGMPGHPWTPQHPAAHLLQHLIPTAALHRTGGSKGSDNDGNIPNEVRRPRASPPPR